MSLAGNSLASAAPGESGQPLPSDKVCTVYSLRSQPPAEEAAVKSSLDPCDDVIFVCCQYEVARERAPAWARAVLGQMTFLHAVFLGSMPAEQFRGQGEEVQVLGGCYAWNVILRWFNMAEIWGTFYEVAPVPVAAACVAIAQLRDVLGVLGLRLTCTCLAGRLPGALHILDRFYHFSDSLVDNPHGLLLPGDASQEELIFALRTRASQQALKSGTQPAVPLLPTGTVVGGLPAALLSYCQVSGLLSAAHDDTFAVCEQAALSLRLLSGRVLPLWSQLGCKE